MARLDRTPRAGCSRPASGREGGTWGSNWAKDDKEEERCVPCFLWFSPFMLKIQTKDGSMETLLFVPSPFFGQAGWKADAVSWPPLPCRAARGALRAQPIADRCFHGCLDKDWICRETWSWRRDRHHSHATSARLSPHCIGTSEWPPNPDGMASLLRGRGQEAEEPILQSWAGATLPHRPG